MAWFSLTSIVPQPVHDQQREYALSEASTNATPRTAHVMYSRVGLRKVDKFAGHEL
jgi:hypothetical protein